MIHNLPNLKYATLVNINYLDCRWLDNFASNTVVRANMCDSEKESLLTKIQSHTDASTPISKVNEMEIIQYKTLEELTTSYEIKYHNHKDAKVIEYNSLDELSTGSDSSYHYDQKITENNSLEELSNTTQSVFHNSALKGIKTSHILHIIDNGGKEIKKRKTIIASVVSVLFLLVVLMVKTIILCRRKFVAWIRGRQEDVQPLSANMMEEISLENQE